MGELTRLGLPKLTERTYQGYMDKLNSLQSEEAAIKFFEELEGKVRDADSLFSKFATDASAMYPLGHDEIALKMFLVGYDLLNQEGELPKLDPGRFEKRWDANMNRAVDIINIGANMPIIQVDNQVYHDFILESSGFFHPVLRTSWVANASSGYMFLADNVPRQNVPDLETNLKQ